LRLGQGLCGRHSMIVVLPVVRSRQSPQRSGF
jgi:hypothetical protein